MSWTNETIRLSAIDCVERWGEIRKRKYAILSPSSSTPLYPFSNGVNEPGRIFVEEYDPAMGKGQSWGVGAVPIEFRQTWDFNFCSFLNIIEEYEYADGTPGKIKETADNPILVVSPGY